MWIKKTYTLYLTNPGMSKMCAAQALALVVDAADMFMLYLKRVKNDN